VIVLSDAVETGNSPPVRMASWTIVAGTLALALALGTADAAPAGDASARSLLEALKAASGGAAWDRPGEILAEGRKTSFGLEGTYAASEDLASGRFARRADYGLFANAEGLDADGRWRMDNSGGVHPLDSDEAVEVARAEAFLARRGYLHPERGDADYVRLDPQTQGGTTYQRIAATPRDGRSVVLWLDDGGRRLARATIARSNRVETLTFDDYRPVGGLQLPFRISVDDGDQSETGVASIARYRMDPAGESPARPPPRADATLAGRAPAWLSLDRLSGLPLVEARIDGAAPMLFVLDTGGHDILTPDAVKTLGLHTLGQGFSLGAGAGSTPTQFAKAARLAIGGTELKDPSFIVLDLDLGQGIGPDGKAAPIAGFIGLELFERFAVTLDYARGELRLCRFETAASDQPGTPIRFADDLPLVRAAVAGQPGWFQLDTGNNTRLILFKAWVEASRLSDALGPSAAHVVGAGVGGPVIFHDGKPQTLTLAGVEVPGVEVLLAGDDMGGLSGRFEAGNIGESVLRRFNVSIDYRRERLVLAPPEARGLCP
jgi:hypothetical protein